MIIRVCYAAATAVAVTLLATPIVRWVAVRCGWISRPTESRWGRRAVARLGGVAMFVGFAASAAVWLKLQPPFDVLLLGSVLVFLLGLLDDLHRLPPYTKLVAQLLIGCIVVMNGIRVPLQHAPWLSVPVSVLWFVFVMNALNLLDNMDGLAAGVASIAATFCAVHAWISGQYDVALLGFILGGVGAGFLFYNFPPAKIFMGDSGSHLLGFNLAALAVIGSWEHSARLLSVLAVPTLVLALPIFDTCFVALQRVVHHQHPFTGGRDHVSHRLAILGLSTRQTVLLLYLLSACLGVVSIVTAGLKPLPVIAIWLSVATLLALFGRYLSSVNVYRLKDAGEAPARAPAGKPNTRIETMLLHKRRLLEIIVDFAIICSAYVFAHLLRFEGQLSSDIQSLVVQSLPVILVIKLSCFAGFGLYRGIWRYLGLADLLGVFKAVSFGSLFSALAMLYLWRFQGYSRAVFVIDWMLTLIAVGGSRVAERVFDQWIQRASQGKRPILIFGAGDTGQWVLRHLVYGEGGAYQVVGLIDDDPSRHGNLIHGCRVLGGRQALPALLREKAASEVFVAINDPPGELLEFVRSCCEPLGIPWRVATAGFSVA